MKEDLFEEILEWVPVERRETYWKLLAYLKNLEEDDEILRLCQAMGVLAVITRQVPMEVGEQHKILKKTLDDFQTEIRTVLTDAHRESETLTATVGGLIQETSNSSKLVAQSAATVETGLRDAANGISMEKLATDVRTKLEATILRPTEEIVTKSAETVRKLEKDLPAFRDFLNRLETYNYGTAWGTAFITVMVLAAFIFGWVWICLNDSYQEALHDSKRSIQQNIEVLDILEKSHRTLRLSKDQDKCYLIMEEADGAFLSTAHEGVLEFSKP